MADDKDGRVRALRQRLDAGLVDRSRVRLAAYLGSPEARALLGFDAPSPFTMPDFEAVEWTAECAADFPSYGKEACVRVAIAVGRQALRSLERIPADHQRCETIFDAALAFARHPCDEHRHAAETIAASDETSDLIQSAAPGDVEEAIHSVVSVASVAGAASAESAADDVGRLIAYRPESLFEALQDEVMPWALGERDPLE